MLLIAIALNPIGAIAFHWSLVIGELGIGNWEFAIATLNPNSCNIAL
jgi:hypothetical protein